MNLHEEPYSAIPLWLEQSSLPALVREKTKTAAGWAVVRQVISVDCARHPSAPGVVELSVNALAEQAGLTPEEVRKVIAPLRKMKVLKCFLPDNDDDIALFELYRPLQTPLTREEIRAKLTHVTAQNALIWRYLDGPEEDDPEAVDTVLQEIVDLYLNTCGTRINMFVVDELRLMRQKYPIEAVRKVFNRARQNQIHSMAWIAGQLSHTGKPKKPKETDTPAATQPNDKENHTEDDTFVF